MEGHFERIEELIKDDNKIVTVASYALVANIPFQDSQKVIDKYVEVNKGSKEVYVTYILNGIKKDSEKILVVQVNDETLDDEKQLFKSEPTVIVYSIQRSKCIDYNIISLVKPDSAVVESTLIGAIVGKNCAPRTLRKKVLPTLPVPTIKGKSTIFFKENSSVKCEIKSEEKINKNEINQETNKVKQVNGKGSIADMFNKVVQTKTSNTKENTSESKPKQSGGLTNFFRKPPSKDTLSNGLEKREIKKEKDIEKEHEINKLDQNTKQNKHSSDLFDSDTDEEILKDLDIHNEKLVDIKIEKNSEKAKSNKNRNSASQKKKRKIKDVGNDKSAKKRKRIIVEDSDSDDIFGSENSDNEENNVKENLGEEPEPTKPEANAVLPKNKRRRAVKRTYEDEEGFIVTQTEYVYETASEDENEASGKVIKKEEEPKPKLEKKSSNSENDVSPNKATKNKKGAKKAPSGNQPTLMNFFKKK